MDEPENQHARGPAGPDGRTAAEEQYAVMAAFGDALLDAQNEGELWKRTVRALVRFRGFAGACLARADADGTLRTVAGSGVAGATLADLTVRLDDAPTSPPAQAWATRLPCLDRDVRDADWLPRSEAPALGSMLALPVRKDGGVSAVLCIAAVEPDAFDEDVQDLCRRVCRLLERWADHHRQLPHLQHQALHDPLTDLPNRRMLEEHLASALSRARRSGTVVAVGVLDLDDFKPINDTCGHAAGDRLLRELGSRLRAELRGQDLLVRLGGDEFALVVDALPAGRASAELASALERLYTAVEAPFDLGQGRSAQVGMSLGVALYPFDGEEIDQLVRQADMAMYRSKATKHSRLDWWQLASASQETPQSETALAPYGAEAASLVARARGLFAETSSAFAATLVAEIGSDRDTSALFGGLGSPVIARHGALLAEHIEGLLAPDAERASRSERAEEVGRVHALAGVGPDSVVRTLGRYRTLLNERLAASSLTARERYRLMQVAEARLQDELQDELHGHSEAVTRHYEISAAPLPAPGTPWIDAVQAELDTLAELPGMRATALQRPAADGRLTVEAHAGAAGARLAQLTREPAPLSLGDAGPGEYGGLVARAWAGNAIERSSDYLHDERTGAWQDRLADLGIRSVMAVPVPGPHDRPVAILGLYGGWAGQFDAPWTRAFAQGLQQRWDALWRRRRDPMGAPALPRPLAERYRERLFAGGLSMYLQPVIDVTDGSLVGCEALARLRLEDDTVLSPGTFLPLLGEAELAQLFRLTLDQALAALVAHEARSGEARAHGAAPAAGGRGRPDAAGARPLEIAVNLPPSTLLEPDCPRWIAEALARHGVAPERLSLELIETEEIGQAARRAAIRSLVDLGVRLSIDDLGSGYSSLQRLAELPFDTMKIDQALVGRMAEQPLQTLSLVGSLVRLGEDLERRVVVEGASDPGLVEVAAILGARFVQGYGIARPMPVEALAGWQAGFVVPVAPDHIRTAAGALAWHWRARRNRSTSHPPSLSACPLDGYFHATGLESSEGARLHDRLHAGMHPAEASERLLEWLIARVQEERDGAPQAVAGAR